MDNGPNLLCIETSSAEEWGKMGKINQRILNMTYQSVKLQWKTDFNTALAVEGHLHQHTVNLRLLHVVGDLVVNSHVNENTLKNITFFQGLYK